MRFALEKVKDIKELLRTLGVGLHRLSLTENFEQQEVMVTLEAGQELSIRNRLNFIPTKCIILFSKGNGLITAGDTPFTRDFLYLKNHGAVQVTATVSFQR